MKVEKVIEVREYDEFVGKSEHFVCLYSSKLNKTTIFGISNPIKDKEQGLVKWKEFQGKKRLFVSADVWVILDNEFYKANFYY